MQEQDSRIAESNGPVDGVGESNPRRIAFQVVVTLVALLILALNVFALMELVLMWLPAETVADVFEEETSFITLHRTHFMAIGVLAWAVVASIIVQLRRPRRRVAPMLLLMTAAVGGAIVYGLSGTLGEWLVEELALVVVPISLVVVLHPRRDRLFIRPRFDRSMLALAGLAALPWAVYVVDNAWAQFVNLAGDTHAEMEHWATAALMGIVILVAGVLGSSNHSGWRLTGWIAAGGSAVFGLHSFVFPGGASALPTIWAVLAVAWGVAFGGMIVRRSRAGQA